LQWSSQKEFWQHRSGQGSKVTPTCLASWAAALRRAAPCTDCPLLPRVACVAVLWTRAGILL